MEDLTAPFIIMAIINVALVIVMSEIWERKEYYKRKLRNYDYSKDKQWRQVRQ